ncbi:hypothetical protein JCM10213_001161 [Rhodosporidiobolus nylandii]
MPYYVAGLASSRSPLLSPVIGVSSMLPKPVQANSPSPMASHKPIRAEGTFEACNRDLAILRWRAAVAAAIPSPAVASQMELSRTSTPRATPSRRSTTSTASTKSSAPSALFDKDVKSDSSSTSSSSRSSVPSSRAASPLAKPAILTPAPPSTGTPLPAVIRARVDPLVSPRPRRRLSPSAIPAPVTPTPVKKATPGRMPIERKAWRI